MRFDSSQSDGHEKPIDHVLHSVHLGSVACGRIEAKGRWGLACGPCREYNAAFFMVARGSCWLSVQHTQGIPLGAGYACLISGYGFSISDTPDTPTTPITDVLASTSSGTPVVISCGTRGVGTTILGCAFQLHNMHSAPADLLPPVIAFQVEQGRRPGLEGAFQLMEGETKSPGAGSATILKRLAEVLLTYAVRAHIETGKPFKPGLFTAVADDQIGRALNLLHSRIDHIWTVAELASSVGMSRSNFALRFKELVGEPPVEYLRRCRITRASESLLSSDGKLAEIAKAVGYDSHVAFIKAFKRITGIPPGEYRRSAPN